MPDLSPAGRLYGTIPGKACKTEAWETFEISGNDGFVVAVREPWTSEGFRFETEKPPLCLSFGSFLFSSNFVLFLSLRFLFEIVSE